MGSPKVINAKPQLPMAEDKKSIKNLLIKPFQSLFQKDKQKKEKTKNKSKQIEVPTKPVENVTVSDLLEKFDNLALRKNEPSKENEEDEDESANFSYKVVEEEDDKRSTRIDSHSSEDSGFADKCSIGNDSDDERDDALVASLKNLKVDPEDKREDERKKKKTQTVYVSRGPIKNRAADFGASVHPYYQDKSDSYYRQISQINPHTFSGGQVIVNETCTDISEQSIDLAIKQVDLNVQNFANNSHEEQINSLLNALEYVQTECEKPATGSFDDSYPNHLQGFGTKMPDPIEEFTTANHINDFDISIFDCQSESSSIFPTPPRSENVASPSSDSHASFYQTNSDYTLSPATSSPISDYEKWQDLGPFVEYPACIVDSVDEKETSEKKKERNSTSSMTMKQFKDMQKELASNFSKKECCQVSRRPCKEIFGDCLNKLKVEERKDMCLKVARLDLKTCYGVLHHVLLNLSNGRDEDVHMALFVLICEKVLALEPLLFVDDFGLSLLKSAVLRCNSRPVLTRYLVQCIRTVTRSEAYKPSKKTVFTEVDALGDSLVTACARAGDAYADVLAEIVRCEERDAPLFNVHQANTDGYSALHVACSEHSAANPCAHILHVLLKHGRADLWQGDIKGGDTPVHVAVNSANCDLKMIMILFQHIDRKEWRKLAHVPNRSSVNPLEYARSAVKSSSRQNYPLEVLDFLKKCR